MRKHFLSKVTYSKLFTALFVIGGAMVPLSSTLADATDSPPPDRFLFGSKPTDYKQFSQPASTPSTEERAPAMDEGPQGPIRSDDMRDMNDSSSDRSMQSRHDERSGMNQSRQATNKLLFGEQPTNYRWFQ